MTMGAGVPKEIADVFAGAVRRWYAIRRSRHMSQQLRVAQHHRV